MSKEIIELLEKARAVARVTEPNKAGYKCIEQHIDRALNFVKQQPSQQECDAAMVEGFEHTISKGEFTKLWRRRLENAVTLYKMGKSAEEWFQSIVTGFREACKIIDSAESINADLLAASERGLSYINAIVCKVPRPITELEEDKEFVEAAIEKAKV